MLSDDKTDDKTWRERLAIIAPANAPSIKLAEKLGFECLHETSYHDSPTLVLKRPAWR